MDYFYKCLDRCVDAFYQSLLKDVDFISSADRERRYHTLLNIKTHFDDIRNEVENMVVKEDFSHV